MYILDFASKCTNVLGSLVSTCHQGDQGPTKTTRVTCSRSRLVCAKCKAVSYCSQE